MEQELKDELKPPEEQDGKPLRLTKTVEICGYCGGELDEPTTCYICGEPICPECEGRFGIRPPDQQEKESFTELEKVVKIRQVTERTMAKFLGCDIGMERKYICRSCFPTFLVELDKAIQNTKDIVMEAEESNQEIL